MPIGIGKELRRCRVPSNMASDLEGFNARPLWQNQECKEARHDSRMDRADAASSTEQAIYNCIIPNAIGLWQYQYRYRT